MQVMLSVPFKRKHGIDLLKCVTMFMVIILHILNYGGVISSCEVYSINYDVARLLHAICVCAVNCFAMITGYLMVERVIKIKNIVGLWIQVLFYSLVITLVYSFITTGTIGIRVLIMTFLPVESNQYWYFTSYFCLFFFIPVLNYLLNETSPKMMQYILIMSLLLFSLLPMIIGRDIFKTESGYSPLWLAIAYLLGGYVNKYDISRRIRIKWAINGFVGSVLFTWMWRIYFCRLFVPVIGKELRPETFYSYTSPTIILAAVLLLCIFLKINIRDNSILAKSENISLLVFAVYLIHDNSIIRNIYILERFSFLTDRNVIEMFSGILLSALLIFTVCIIIEWFRMNLFNFLRVYKIADWIGAKFQRFIPY